ncbi:anoctamin-10 isoform X1 [Diorhabda sublineata]|uniref:anoctamin-10 isoform X1 n=2 Tax=Diorhabda sublineata TaxID=1163346 RepID=UPI0024E147CD|nr:anoctamin-10 isoform X1 [Diorhabda sublineata]
MEVIYEIDAKSVTSNLNYSDDDEDEEEQEQEEKEVKDLFLNSLWDIHEALSALRGNMRSRLLDADTAVDEMEKEIGDVEEMQLPPTYLVIQLSSDIPLSTLTWFVEKIRGKKRDGGGELFVMKQPFDPEDSLFLHVSASKIKLFEAAEEMELMKKDKAGVLREFTVQALEDFLTEDMSVDGLFTIAERQTITRHELENIRALTEDNHIPGFPEYRLYGGQSIVQVCLSKNIIKNVYPLHDDETLKKLGRSWYKTLFKKQPFDQIKNYFGESITLYFHFLSFYTDALIVPVILGILQLFVSRETIPFFCIFNVVWVTLFLEMWRRKSNELAYQWGTIGMTSMDEPRPNFRGAMGVDAITGKVRPQAPRYLTYVKMYVVSIPIVFVCLTVAFVIMLMSFWAEDYAKKNEDWKSYVSVPSIIYSVLVIIMNVIYRQLATYLTEWENHRTQSQYERHRVTKLVLFEFVNNFMSLFYIAFITKDMEMLRSQLQTMLIVNQTINHFQETVQPLAIKYYMMKVNNLKISNIIPNKVDFKAPKACREDKTITAKENLLSNIIMPEIPEEDSRIKQAIDESDMDIYEGTYDDYLELFIQFGFVFLFSSVYPLAALWALLNNVIEIRADAFKFCKIFQRPTCRRVKDIGAWQRSFEMIGALSILTNCGLLYLSPPIRQSAPSFSDIEWLLLFIFLEHFLLGIRFLLHIAISDKPEWVRVALAKRSYESKQALKFERSQKNQRILTRRFKTFHGPHTD